MLLAAKRPVLHAGHGVLWAQAWDELRELAELLQIPVMTTMAGKSAFPEDHPLALGAGGHSMTESAAPLPGQVGPGVRRRVQLRQGLVLVPDPGGKKIVQIVVDGTRRSTRTTKVDHAVIGDAKLVLRQVIDEIKRRRHGEAARWRRPSEVKRAKDAFLDSGCRA